MELKANEKTLLSFSPEQVLTVVTSEGAQGLAVRLARVPGGGDAQSVTALAANTTYRFGPYPYVERFEISLSGGNATITVDEFNPATLPINTPVNATPVSLTILAALIPTVTNDTVKFSGNTFTKVASGPGANQFTNTAGLSALLDGVTGWNSTVSGSDIIVTSEDLGADVPLKTAEIDRTVMTTAGGGVAAKATGTIAAADIALLAVGDKVTFDGSTFTKVTASPEANEFTDTAGLASLLDDLTDWTASVSGSDIDIEAAAVGDTYNGKKAVFSHYRTTTAGTNGTVGVSGEVCVDGSYLYISTDESTATTANWRRISLGSAF